jgi:DNA processing protein
MKNPFHLLKLTTVPGIGPRKIRLLIETFGSSKNIFQASLKDLAEVEGMDHRLAYAIHTEADSRFAEDQLELCRKQSVRIITLEDDHYPQTLFNIYDPPSVLFVKGQPEAIHGECLAIVGTRRPSQYGRCVAEKFSREAVSCGICVVSGMARGVDAWAHRGALESGGNSVAVLGNGVDIIYPRENRHLYREIQEKGAVISEYPMGTPPSPSRFPRRNRIISGLSRGTLVVEAGRRSGALITAYQALEQSREVFAIPGDIGRDTARGPHHLIQQGAKLIERIEDILAEIPAWSVKDLPQENSAGISDQLTPDEKKLWDILADGPVHVDQIASRAGMSVSRAMVILLEMELKRQIKQLPGMRYQRGSV